MARAPPATFPPMNRFKHKFVGLRELVLRDSNAVVLLPPLVPHHFFTAHTPLYFFGQRCSLYHLIAVDLSSITSKSGGLAQVITQCTVPGTATFTFDDVRALLLAYPIYIF